MVSFVGSVRQPCCRSMNQPCKQLPNQHTQLQNRSSEVRNVRRRSRSDAMRMHNLQVGGTYKIASEGEQPTSTIFSPASLQLKQKWTTTLPFISMAFHPITQVQVLAPYSRDQRNFTSKRIITVHMGKNFRNPLKSSALPMALQQAQVSDERGLIKQNKSKIETVPTRQSLLMW